MYFQKVAYFAFATVAGYKILGSNLMKSFTPSLFDSCDDLVIRLGEH